MLTRFVLYGLLGWCGEVFWTSIENVLRNRVLDWQLKGHSYLWSFPIYGSAAFFFEPLHTLMRSWPWFVRGVIYVIGIWTVEYTVGRVLKFAVGQCPWDYTGYSHQLHGLICWSYFPIWFVFGFVLEYLHDKLILLTPQINAVFVN